MKRIWTIIVANILFQITYAQQELSVFTATGRAGVSTTFATDYQSLGINPANLGWGPHYEGKKFAFSLAEAGVSIFSEALTKSQLRESIDNIDKDAFDIQQKLMAAQQFTNSALAINADINILGLSYQPDTTIGGFAFTIRDRIQWYSKMNNTLAEIMFLGYNAPYFDQKFNELGQLTQNPDSVASAVASVPKMFSEILDGSRLSLSWMREYHIGYGRRMLNLDNLELYVGAGVKYMVGIGIIDLRSENGDFNAFSALSPVFDVDYGAAAKLNPTTVAESSGLPKNVGSGLGFDLGVNLIIKEKLKLGLAVTDIGSITWDGNVYEASDDSLINISTGGLDSYNIFLNAGEFTGDSGIFKWDIGEERTVSLPTALRVGASYKLIDKIEVGADMILPMNDVSGNFADPLIAIGLDVLPAKWVRLSTGMSTGGNYDFNVPLGITFIAGNGTWEAGVASRDLFTFFTQDNPTLSASIGFLRFRL